MDIIEDGSGAISRNLVYIKYKSTSDNGNVQHNTNIIIITINNK
jgi:hypothetical protein